MADKMWDILNFLKNPSGDSPKDTTIQNVEAKIKEINAQIEDAIEHPERERPAKSDAVEAAPAGDAAPNTADAPDADGEPEQSPDERSGETEPVGQAGAPEMVGSPDGRLFDVPVSSVRPNPFQPRKELGEAEILELSESIREFGVIQPIIVRRDGDGYELIAGERRLRAATRAGLASIPAVVVETEPLNQQIIALVENIQRKNLSSIEEAVSLQDILGKTGWSQSELSRRMGRSQASIANKLRLLRLDPDVQGLVMSGRLGERQARSLISLPPEDQRVLAQRAVDEDLSARALETLAENCNKGPSQPKRRAARGSSDGPGGELLGDVAALVNRHRGQGLMAQWKVKQMNQSSLVVEITVDLMNNVSESSEESA